MKKLFVLCAAAIFVVAFTAPAFAAEWSFYGSARIGMFWQDTDSGDFLGADGEDSDSDLNQDLFGTSRFGANVKAGDNLTGKVELGFKPTDVAYTRVIWGEYDFGGFKLGVGQNYVPVNYFISNQVFDGDMGMLPFGGIYDGREPMVQARIGDFKFAFVSPQSSTSIVDPITGISYGGVDTDISWPKLEASWAPTFGAFSLKILGGYNQYKVVSATEDETLDSYILGAGAKFDMGPFYVGGDVYIGKNTGNFGIWTGGASGVAAWDAVNTKLVDSDAFGWLFVVGFKMSDMFAFEGGLGNATFEYDISGADKSNMGAWYVQANIAFAKGVFIVPEIGQLDSGDDVNGRDIGKTTYYGLKWQINF
jgi:hypothetical protein